jgi:hypothetical protein
MKPFHFALIALAFFLLALIAFFVYQNADTKSPAVEVEIPSEVVVTEKKLPVVTTQGTVKPLTELEMIDSYVKDIDASVSSGKFMVATTTLDLGYATIDKKLYTDTTGTVVRYSTEGGTDHQYAKADYYYQQGVLRFARVTAGRWVGDMEASADYTIYFGTTGQRIKETYKPSGDKEYALPETRTEDSLIRDPKADFALKSSS